MSYSYIHTHTLPLKSTVEKNKISYNRGGGLMMERLISEILTE